MMRWYCIDELTAEDTARISAHLTARGLQSSVQGLFWLPVPEHLLSEEQVAHKDSCGPHVLALEVEEHSLRLELLVRARNCLRCSCIHYAGPSLLVHMTAFLEQLLRDAHVSA